MPRTVHEVIAHLACRLSRWDDRWEHFFFGLALLGPRWREYLI